MPIPAIAVGGKGTAMHERPPRCGVGALTGAVLFACLGGAVAAPAPECLVEWRVAGALASTIRCTDGDPACDADGVADGACIFAPTVCVSSDGCASTAASVRVAGMHRAASAAPWPGPIAAGCAAPASLRVGRRHRTGVAVVARDAAGAVDRDRLRLRCDAPAEAAARAVVIATDFQTGILETVRVGTPHRIGRPADPIHSDAIVRVAGERVYVVNRLGGDNVQTLDPLHGLRTLQQCSTGVGSNPHDLALAGPHKAYVTRYDSDRLWIVDPEARNCDAGFRLGTIDLGAFADADGLPEMDQLLLDGTTLYVTVQRLDRDRNFAPSALRSAVVMIDTATDTVIDAIVLAGSNAFGDASGIQREPGTGKLLINQAGNIYKTGDGGIERVDPAARRSEGYVVDETALGGNITDFVMLSATKGYAVVLDDALRNKLVAFAPGEGVLAKLYGSDQFLPDITLAPDGMLWLADRTRADPGIRIFDPATDTAVTRAPIRLDLPPFAIGFLR